MLNLSFGRTIELLVHHDQLSDDVAIVVCLDSVVDSNSWQVSFPEVNSVSNGLHIENVEGLFLSSSNDVLCFVICLVLIRLLDVASVNSRCIHLVGVLSGCHAHGFEGTGKALLLASVQTKSL